MRKAGYRHLPARTEPPLPTCANTPGRSSRACWPVSRALGPDSVLLDQTVTGAPGLWAPCCSGARRQVLPQGSCRVWTRTRHLAPLVRSSMMLGGTRVGSEKGGNAGSNRTASGGIFMGYGREETVYPAGLVCGGWRSATATARSLRTSTRFSWHDFLSNVSRYRQNGGNEGLEPQYLPVYEFGHQRGRRKLI